MPSSEREFDVVVYGATGFAGKLTAKYLAEHAPPGTRIALAGRSESKLEATRSSLPAAAHDWPLIVADADSPTALDAMVARTRVVCTTVGPYLKYGESLVAACATAGTDYVDLTGEVPFIRFSIDKFDDVAKGSGARIVHACGFDSIPSDLGVYVLAEKVKADGAGTLTDTDTVVKAMRGGISGGTLDTMRVVSDLAKQKEFRRLLLNPHALSSGPGELPRPERGSESNDIIVASAASVDPSLKGSLAPFLMASFNTRVVRRSNHLLDGAYGPDFKYTESMRVGKGRLTSRVAAAGVAGALGGFFGALGVKPARAVIDRLAPKPGEGPSEASRDRGFFDFRVFTTTTTGQRYGSTAACQGDPGYKATALMLGEAALTLALNREELPDRTGVLTPAAAMGDALTGRLRAAGMTLEAYPL